MKTYRFNNAGRQETVRAPNAVDALAHAIQAARSGGAWQPDAGSEHTVTHRVSVACLDDEQDSATASAQMWP